MLNTYNKQFYGNFYEKKLIFSLLRLLLLLLGKIKQLNVLKLLGLLIPQGLPAGSHASPLKAKYGNFFKMACMLY